jgi:voltage-gated potassium channel
MEKLREIVEGRNTRAGRVFDYTIQALIILSIISFSIETLPDLELRTQELLRSFQLFTVIIFTLEYGLRIMVATRKLKYIFSPFGIIDLLAVLPFYIGTGVDLRAIRAFRLLRLFGMFKLVRYSEALQRIHIALKLARAELVLFLSVALIMLYMSAVGIYYFEGQAQPELFGSVFHSLWWAVSTLTTVGYGDVFPITIGGKIFTFFVLMVGLSLIATPAGIISSSLTEARKIMSQEH